MTAQEDIDALAGEYVLGTLDTAERAALAARAAREPEVAAAITAWERRLAPLGLAVPALEPSAGLLARIEERLAAAGSGAQGPSTASRPDAATIGAAATTSASAAATTTGGALVIDLLEARARRWRNLAVAASALAACLMVVIGLRETVLAPAPQSFVAVFHRDDELPAFLMTIDLATRQLTVRPVGAARATGRTYQLWIASDQLGPAPRSLGLIGDGGAPAKAMLTAYEPALLHRATFGVSLEPAGGSPTGRPTSPALHARLYPATP